jgi:hypothetical protein
MSLLRRMTPRLQAACILIALSISPETCFNPPSLSLAFKYNNNTAPRHKSRSIFIIVSSLTETSSRHGSTLHNACHSHSPTLPWPTTNQAIASDTQTLGAPCLPSRMNPIGFQVTTSPRPIVEFGASPSLPLNMALSLRHRAERSRSTSYSTNRSIRNITNALSFSYPRPI